MALPLRLSLRYHPLFLELGRHIQKRTWGPLRGVELQSSLGDSSQVSELIALFCYILGLPEQHRITSQGTVHHLIMLYPTWAVQLLITIVPSLNDTPSLWGSLSFSKDEIIEFRFGRECFIAHGSEDGHFYHIALPEGDPEQYRALDREGHVLSQALERAVEDFIQSLAL